VIIHISDLVGVAARPSEDHPPLVVDPDRIETFEVSAQFLQTIGRRHREIAYSGRRIDRFELALGTTRDRLKVANNLILEQRRGPLVRRIESPMHHTAYRDAVRMNRRD
jgi:hypothetical protein